MTLRIFVIGVLLWSSIAVAADERSPVGRSTSDRDADLIAEWNRRGDFDSSRDLVAAEIESKASDSDAVARWLSIASTIEYAAMRLTDECSDDMLREAQAPIDRWMANHPMHRRVYFLEFARLQIEITAAGQDVLAVSVNANDTGRSDRGLLRLTQVELRLAELSTKVRALLANQQSLDVKSRDEAFIGDLQRLDQEIQVAIVSCKLMQTELFPPASSNRFAAASAARSASDKAIAHLPSECQARLEIERLRIIAMIRGDDFSEAKSALLHLANEVPVALDHRLRALSIQIDLGLGDQKVASKKLAAFYGDNALTAPTSIEMDLVQLEFLLRQDKPSSDDVGRFIKAIELRNGAYGRRRAEMIAIGAIDTSSAESSKIAPSIIAAQGRDYLRNGESERAAQLLASAAMAQSSADEAMELAIQSAAAFVSANQSLNAADVLSGVAKWKSAASKAPAGMLEAAVLRSKAKAPAGEVESALQSILTLWPASPEAVQASLWFVRLLDANNRLIEAAEISTLQWKNHPESVDVTVVFGRWTQAARKSKSNDELTKRFQQSFESIQEKAEVKERYSSWAAYHFSREELAGLSEFKAPRNTPEELFAQAIYEFRRSDSVDSFAVSELFKTPPPGLVPDVVDRLMKDARETPNRRTATAKWIQQWPGVDSQSLDACERFIWLGDLDNANQLIETLISNAANRGDMLRSIATILSTSEDARAKQEAVRRWDQLASGLPIGSEPWHQSKLSAIEVLRELGNSEEAKRRASYILLTKPPGDAKTKNRYENASRFR